MRERKKNYQITDELNTNMSYAVFATADRLLKHRHAWKAWKALIEFGCKVYVVAPGLPRFEGSKIYSDLADLQDKVDVVVPCLRAEYLSDIAKNTAAAGAKYLWFQEQNWTEELQAQCEENGITVIRGCILKHKVYKKPWAFINPCYWHGWKENKVPGKFVRSWH